MTSDFESFSKRRNVDRDQGLLRKGLYLKLSHLAKPAPRSQGVVGAWRALIMDEAGLIRFFMDMTGQSESSARCVVMFLDILERDYFSSLDGTAVTEETRSSGQMVPYSSPARSAAALAEG